MGTAHVEVSEGHGQVQGRGGVSEGVSERATQQMSVKGWSLVKHMEKGGKAFQIRMAF